MKDLKRKKILFFVNSYAGGAEKMTLNIAGFLDKERYEVIFYVIGKDLGLIQNFLPKENRVEHLKIKSYKDGLILKIYHTIRIEKPEFVFSSLMPINWRLCLASMLFPKVKVVIRVNNYLYTQSIFQKIRLFLAYRSIHKLIVQTDEMNLEHRKILWLPDEKVITLANPVNIAQIEKKIQGGHSVFDKDNINYVFVGRIDKVKGIDILIEAFSNVLLEQDTARLYIVGETGGGFSNYFLELRKLTETLKIEDRVSFVGFSDNPYLYMKHANCFVLASRNEGLPNVIVESLYLGTPVAVTNSVPVINRIVRHGIDGYITEVDNVGGLSSAMLNASKLGRVSSGYKSASKEDFQILFNY